MRLGGRSQSLRCKNMPCDWTTSGERDDARGAKYVCRRCGRIIWNINPPETWNGTVLCRGESAPGKPPPDPPLNRGVGTELHKLLESLGIKPDSTCNCAALAAEYDRRGVQWCRENKSEIVAHLSKAYRSTDWTTAIRAGANAVSQGLPLTIEGLCEVAIERAEQAP